MQKLVLYQHERDTELATVVDIYCRTATDDTDTEQRLDKQEAACRSYCDRMGLSIGKVYRDIAAGVQYRDRPGLSELRSRYKDGATSGVVVTHLDRATRSLADLAAFLAELAHSHATVHTASEQLEHNLIYRLIVANQ